MVGLGLRISMHKVSKLTLTSDDLSCGCYSEIIITPLSPAQFIVGSIELSSVFAGNGISATDRLKISTEKFVNFFPVGSNVL